MVVTCDIQFEKNPEAIYYAGQVVMGKATLTVDKIKQVEAVYLKVNGTANTRWKKRDMKNSSEIIYCAQVDYINTVTCLLAPKSTGQAVIIEPGIHTFSFACHIPVNCPSSFEGDHGNIRFLVQISLVRPWKFDHIVTKSFTVLTIKDLNYDSSLLKLPVTNNISKTFCCGPFSNHPLQINVQLPQTGFVPGQLIPVNIMIDNESTANINEIFVRLVMVVDYFSTQPNDDKKSEEKTISKLIGDPVLRKCKKELNYQLPVPATPPTCTTLCSIIKIAYRVEVEAKMGIMYSSQCIRIPVTIGNVPLHNEGMVVQQQPMPRQLNYENEGRFLNENFENLEYKNDFATCNENKEPWSGMGNISAPVYMVAAHMSQATHKAEDNIYECGEIDFTPRYPVFKLPNSIILQPVNADEIDAVTDPNKTTWL